MPVVYIPQEPMRYLREPAHNAKPSLSDEAYAGRVTGAGTGTWVPTIDLRPVKKYGDVRILQPPGKVTVTPAVMARIMRTELQHFSDEDFIVCVGPPVVMVAAGIVAANNNNGKVKFLEWDKQIKKYHVVKFNAYAG